jgi:hypothetical protein
MALTCNGLVEQISLLKRPSNIVFNSLNDGTAGKVWGVSLTAYFLRLNYPWGMEWV